MDGVDRGRRSQKGRSAGALAGWGVVFRSDADRARDESMRKLRGCVLPTGIAKGRESPTLCLILIVYARSDGAKIAVTWPNLLLDLVVLLSFFRD